MLKTKVILSSVTNLSDARYASGMGVDYIGFAINPESGQYVTVEEAKSIKDWLSGVSIIGDVGDALPDNISEYSSSNIQTNDISLVDKLDGPILKLEITVENIGGITTFLNANTKSVNFFIISVDAKQLFSLQPQLKEICRDYPVYISTKYDNQNLSFVLEEINPTGIVLYGSKETKPGLSSYDGIADILEQLEED
jgi:phosphoribosylanthranilate isomerase